jgi:putative spermidine/putrescine transport system permease protein
VGGGRIITLPVLLFSFAGSGDTALTGAMSIIFLLPSVVILVFTGRFLSGTSAGMRGFEHL